MQVLPTLEEGYDLIFIDANKREYPEYFKAAVGLLRSGGFILADNVSRDGKVYEELSRWMLRHVVSVNSTALWQRMPAWKMSSYHYVTVSTSSENSKTTIQTLQNSSVMSNFKEFKEFAMKGNVMDMAIGVIIGAAFGAIVTSLSVTL